MMDESPYIAYNSTKFKSVLRSFILVIFIYIANSAIHKLPPNISVFFSTIQGPILREILHF